MENIKDWLLGGLIVLVLALGVYGWIANIYWLIHGSGSVGLFAVRLVGIFIAPLGAVLGYF